MHIALQVLLWTIVGHGGLAIFLTLAPRLGSGLANAVARAPGLDLAVALMTWVPWVVGAWFAGWLGVLASIGAQAVVLALWTTGHEWMHPKARKGPRIVKVLNKIVGRAPNHLALWATLPALPAFWMIRVAQVFAYPLLRVTLNFPKYKHSEWVMVSRHKFDGLVGHDLIWCLYCDWMTGVYSLGGEMLRNVESFWCPIRFYDGKKCDNCKVDFPDIEGGWVKADGNMEDVAKVMEEKYGSGRREWFGHPVRLTVKGEEKQ